MYRNMLRDQFTLLAGFLSACLLLAYWLFISIDNAYINALFFMTVS